MSLVRVVGGRRVQRVVVLCAGVMLLAGCASSEPPDSVAVRTYRGFPGVDHASGQRHGFQRYVRLGPSRLALTFFGSSSCPPVPTAIHWVSRARLQVTVSASYPGACTADYAPITSVISIAPGRLPSSTVTLQFLGDTSGLPAVAPVR